MSDQFTTATRGAGIRRGIAALITLVGLLVVVPIVLFTVGGDPIPDHVASLARMGHNLTSRDTSGRLFLGLTLIVAWLGWAAFALSVLLEIIGRLRSRPALRIPGFAVPRRAAAGLFAAVAIMIGSGGLGATAFAADAPAPPAVVVTIGSPVPLSTPAAATSTLVYHVQHGDTLGGIAERFLGDFESFPRLVTANQALVTNGADNIQPGWVLHLPSDARDRGTHLHATGTLASTLATPAAGPVSVTIGAPVPVTTIGGTTKVVGTASVPGQTPVDLVSFGQPRHLSPTEAATPAAGSGGVSSILVASALTLTTGAIGAHLLLWSRRRRMSAKDAFGNRYDGVVLGPEPIRDTPESIELNRLDLALRDLSSLLGDREGRVMPDIMGSWIADGAVHLMLTEPCDEPPAPWIAEGPMWTLPAHAPTNTYFAGTTPPLPALVTVGGGEDKRVLLDLERLGVVTIGGDQSGANDLLRHVGAELSHGIWSDDVTIGIAGFNDDDTRRLTALGGGRVRASDSIADALDDAGRWINEAHERLAGLGVNNVLSGRVHATPAEARRLSPYALLLAGPGADDLERLERVDAYLEGRGRGQLAIAATQRPETRPHNARLNRGRWPLTVGADHTVTMEFLDTRVRAASLDGDELASLADASQAGMNRSIDPADLPDIPVGRHRAGYRRQASVS